jgi:integrase
MTPRKRKSRIYWRGGRAWGDFRDYADAGGTREPLIADGEKLATADSDTAEALAVTRLAELRVARRRRHETGRTSVQSLALAIRDHLIAKKKAGKVTDGWIAATEGFLRRAVAFFGADRELEAIRPSDVREYAAHLATLPARAPRQAGKAGKGKEPERPARTMTPYSVRAHLFALSNLYRRAQEDELVPVGFNPVAALMEKPAIVRREARWLEVPDAALYLESASALPAVVTAAGEAIGAELAAPLIGAFLLTGGRLAEVLGLELDDVSFDRRTVTFRPNTWRRLKTRSSWRVIPLWPQLEELLRAWVFGIRLELGGRLLFPSFASGQEAPLRETRRLLDRIAGRIGWKRGEIRHRLFRHTYCAARLQTLDRGAPVSLYTVSRELGHGSEDMVRRVYSHLGTVRHRAEAVEYRVEQHFERLGDQLIRLRSGTTNVTKLVEEVERETPADTEVSTGEDLPEWARRDSNARPLAPEASALSN